MPTHNPYFQEETKIIYKIDGCTCRSKRFCEEYSRPACGILVGQNLTNVPSEAETSLIAFFRGRICKHDGILSGMCLLQHHHCLVSLLPLLIHGQGCTLEVMRQLVEHRQVFSRAHSKIKLFCICKQYCCLG